MLISKILVVDDAATDRMNLQQILVDAGYQVVVAASGQEALDNASSEQPDLIFLDIVMESMDGYQACRKLSTEEVTKDIPVIMVSCNTQDVDKMWAAKQGAKAYITKPYTASDIINQIQKLQ